MKATLPDEAKVLLFLLVLLGGLELSARLFETKLSKDVEHIRSFPAEAARLKAAPDAKLKVLIIGNSLSRSGLDKPLLREGLAKLYGREVELAAMHPDGSNIGQWLYGYRRYFDQAGVKPDLVLLVTARMHLSDSTWDPSQLAAFYTSASDLPDLIRRQKFDVEMGSQALIARLSTLFAHRNRVQPLLFYNVVPSYADTVQELNTQRGPSSQGGDQPREKDVSCDALTALLDTWSQVGVKAVVIAVPLPEAYDLPQPVLKAAQTKSVSVLVRGSQAPLESHHFPDGYHLDEAGARQFTQQVLEDLRTSPLLLKLR